MTEQKNLLKTLSQIADGITSMFGENCEVVVHDPSRPEKSLVHIAGKVTGREVGAPATDLLMKELRRKSEEIDDIHNYKTTHGGRTIKSTTLFIRNSKGEVTAALCINLDITELYNATQTLTSLVNCSVAPENNVQETFSNTASETIESIVEQTLLQCGKQPATMSSSERFYFTSLLEKQGVFQMKGAVKHIAKRCGISQFTIYNYLKTLRNTHPNKEENHNEKSYPN